MLCTQTQEIDSMMSQQNNISTQNTMAMYEREGQLEFDYSILPRDLKVIACAEKQQVLIKHEKVVHQGTQLFRLCL